ncbi:hypothetical protein CBOM_07623 [Ceraceosorus bombacis]|uniref:Uncharacterized protein n=1 Tax=Ceraceosorus bombacis TaxID=401625 RepID=A0A0P1BH54_9BASI|nr:hypothetical protein CBOM_07623 [Ceraceosorus bombacis]
MLTTNRSRIGNPRAISASPCHRCESLRLTRRQRTLQRPRHPPSTVQPSREENSQTIDLILQSPFKLPAELKRKQLRRYHPPRRRSSTSEKRGEGFQIRINRQRAVFSTFGFRAKSFSFLTAHGHSRPFPTNLDVTTILTSPLPHETLHHEPWPLHSVHVRFDSKWHAAPLRSALKNRYGY